MPVAHRRPSDAHALAPRGVDQPAGMVSRRVSKDAAGARRPQRLRVAARSQPCLEARQARARVGFAELQFGVEHDAGFLLQPALPVVKPELVERPRAFSGWGEHPRPPDHPSHGAPVGARVHRDPAAHRPRDPRRELQPGQPPGRGGPAQVRQARPAPGDDPAAVVADLVLPPAGFDHHPAHAAVRDQHIAPTAQDDKRLALPIRPRDGRDQVVERSRQDQDIGGAPDPKGHVPGEGLVRMHAPRAQLPEGGEDGVLRHATHAPALPPPAPEGTPEGHRRSSRHPPPRS